MRLAKGESKPQVTMTKVEVEIEKAIYETILAMEKHTQISKVELINTALKRFIAAHKDYLPDSAAS